jgi:hypothetical protein
MDMLAKTFYLLILFTDRAAAYFVAHSCAGRDHIVILEGLRINDGLRVDDGGVHVIVINNIIIWALTRGCRSSDPEWGGQSGENFGPIFSPISFFQLSVIIMIQTV